MISNSINNFLVRVKGSVRQQWPDIEGSDENGSAACHLTISSFPAIFHNIAVYSQRAILGETMKQSLKTSAVLIVFLVLAVMTAVTALYASGAESPAKKLDGKAIFEQKCLKCHKIAKFKEQENSRKDWVIILSRMQRGTCPMTEEELEALADYLAKAYGN